MASSYFFEIRVNPMKSMSHFIQTSMFWQLQLSIFIKSISLKEKSNFIIWVQEVPIICLKYDKNWIEFKFLKRIMCTMYVNCKAHVNILTCACVSLASAENTPRCTSGSILSTKLWHAFLRASTSFCSRKFSITKTPSRSNYQNLWLMKDCFA